MSDKKNSKAYAQYLCGIITEAQYHELTEGDVDPATGIAMGNEATPAGSRRDISEDLGKIAKQVEEFASKNNERLTDRDKMVLKSAIEGLNDVVTDLFSKDSEGSWKSHV